MVLDAGSLALLPYGDAHTLSHEAGAAVRPAEELMPTLVQTGRLGRGGPCTRLVCGHFDLDRDSRHPLLTGLPPLVAVASGSAAPWAAAVAGLAAAESRSAQPGAAAIVDRLAEAMMIRILRQWSEASGVQTGFLAAATDPGLGAALQAMHQQTARAWTIGALARVAGMSRTVFAQRFKSRLQMTPHAYLVGWRLLKSRQWMEETDDGLDEIARRAGYADVFSFAKAFKRAYGVAPGTWRRAR